MGIEVSTEGEGKAETQTNPTTKVVEAKTETAPEGPDVRKVQEGYIMNATCWVDGNCNKINDRDSGEVQSVGLTNERGDFTFGVNTTILGQICSEGGVDVSTD